MSDSAVPSGDPGSVFWGWAGPALITIFAAVLRFYHLGQPRAVIFDETYYVPDSYSILRHGVELRHVKNVNALLVAGNSHFLTRTSEYVAHPPAGKIMMALGQWIFGLTPFGWRFSVAVAGSLAVLMTARIARRLTRSTLLGCVAGLLLALDGLEFALSRVAILDIFVMFWVLAAAGLLVIDRDRNRARLASAATRFAVPWLRVLAGVCLGLACGTKWNAVWYIPAFALLILAWDAGARRAAGQPDPWRRTLLGDVTWYPAWLAAIPAAVYTACWTGWFATADGYDRSGTALNGGHPASALVAWYQYNKSMLGFGLGLRSPVQPYQSNPLGWLLLTRPTSFYFQCLSGCHPQVTQTSVISDVTALGTPLIWWGGTAALIGCLAWLLLRGDWRAGTVIAGVAAGWLPWIWFSLHDHRIEFYYYAVVFDPFLVIAITLGIGLLIGRSDASAGRRAVGAVAAGSYLVAVLLNFAYIYPQISGSPIAYGSWLSRLWLHGWL